MKMTMKRISAALLCVVLLLSVLTACGGDPGAGKETASSIESAGTSSAEDSKAASDTANDGAAYKVGICQLTPHPALDAATKGFRETLEAEFGDKIKFDEQNAANDSATCATIVNGFVSSRVDLILANATPALQAAATATSEIPVLGTSVTEYGVALGLKDFSGTVGGNVSGTSDLAPLDQQAQMIKDWYPDLKTVGLIYCSNENNSQYQVDTVQTYLEELGYTCTQYPFSDSNDMSAVVQTAADSSDIIYVPTDNTCASSTGIIDNICRPAKIPVFCGEEGIARGCGVATLSISYYDLGVATGKMAIKILKGEAKISEMPVEYAATFTPKYNKTICDELGIAPPTDGYEEIAAE